MTDPFFAYPRTTVTTSAGDVQLPILYYDASVLLAMFTVDPDRVERLLDKALQPVRLLSGKALMIMACYEYRDTSVGVYNEVGIALWAAPRKQTIGRRPLASLYSPLDHQHTGVYITDLPVTTPQANAAGREIWGYPKFITPIEFSLKQRAFSCTTVDPDTQESIVTLSGTVGLGIPLPPISPVIYSRKDDHLLRTLVNVRGTTQSCLPGSLRLVLGSSTHPMTERLRLLGVDQRQPFCAQYSHRFQSRLNAGANVEP